MQTALEGPSTGKHSHLALEHLRTGATHFYEAPPILEAMAKAAYIKRQQDRLAKAEKNTVSSRALAPPQSGAQLSRHSMTEISMLEPTFGEDYADSGDKGAESHLVAKNRHGLAAAMACRLAR